jgi:nucleolar protein 56
MKCFIIDTLIGTFAVDEAINIVNFIDFEENVEEIIEFYEKIEQDILVDKFRAFINQLSESGYDDFIFDNEKLASLSTQLGIRSQISKKDLDFKYFRLDLKNQLNKLGIHKDKKSILSIYKTVSEELIKNQVQAAGGKEELIIIQVIETLDIVKKSISLFSSRLREWYGLHFPELTDKLVEDNIILAKMVSSLGNRSNYSILNIESNFEMPEKRVEVLHELAKESMGANIDLSIVKNYANQIISLDVFRAELEEHLDKLMMNVAPNLTALIGSLIGAKLISKAGSLKKLAFMPASRIQLLGAEKALYRFLKTGEKRPKHGLIFQWNQIRGSRQNIRGKIARTVAGKLGIASKVDYFDGEYIGDDLNKEIESKIKEIEMKYPKSRRKTKKNK